LRSRRGLIRLGAAAAAAVLIALVVPAVAPAQQFPGLFEVDTRADGNDGECNRDCTLREAVNLAAQSGQTSSIQLLPGVYRLTGGTLTLRNVLIFGPGLSGGQGAGARTTIIDGRGNRVFEVPAGSSSIVAGVTVTGGAATTGAGAFVASEGVLNLYNVIVEGNTAGARGGGVHNLGILSVQNSTVSGNRVNDGVGGGIASDGGSDLRILSSTISGNSATSTGGGIYSAGSAIIAGTTVAGNNAGSGGAIFHDSAAGGTVSLWNSIVARSGASGDACAGTVIDPGSSNVTGNLSDDASCGFAPGQGVMSTDPLLAPIANNGGPTDTRALREGSPAIDAGNAQLCGVTSTDQRRAPFVNNCDIGAFEFGGVPPQTELPAPVAGQTVNVSEARGTVKVKLPGSDEFFDLEDAQQVPIGSTFNTNRGRVNLIAAGQQRSWFYQGTFRLGQTRGRKPLSTLTLTGALSCGKSANIAAKKKRRLWGDGRGKFRTKGKHSAATVVGTRWLVEDRCNGTLTRVRKGRVRVRDFRARRTVVVKAGKQYFARAR
jgi:CSLREA domain-containing protein